MNHQSALLRPDWTPATIALMILGFVVFWPLGLAMLAYILFGERLRDFKRDVNQKADGMFAGCGRHRGRYRQHFSTGNVAFDDWRRAELERLEEERRKLDEEVHEFHDYLRNLHMARDREEFDRFIRERQSRQTPSTPDNGPTTV